MSIESISVVDGRYLRDVGNLSEYASEKALIRYRVQVEIEWFLHLHQSCPEIAKEPLPPSLVDTFRQIYRSFNGEDAKRVVELERQTNHDVKAVEYFVREKLSASNHPLNLELVHFCCTSEDINNLAYALMLVQIRDDLLTPAMSKVERQLQEMSIQYAGVAMLAHTHGQTASPTTMGKELAIFQHRLSQWYWELAHTEIYGKFNGAVGNYNAHVVASPTTDWPAVTGQFIRGLGLKPNILTTQIEPHDCIARYCNALSGYNQVILDLCRDIWTYISMAFFKLKVVKGEVGSSTMPHKVNPIDFENAEGNVGIANSLLTHLAQKLPVSRLQRDLSDSTVQRNLGSALGYCLTVYSRTLRGLKKLEIDENRLSESLFNSWEVLAEAIQTVMRKEGIADAYEQIKSVTRGQALDQDMYRQIIHELPLSREGREVLLSLTPATYIGLARHLTLRNIISE
ncbi:MAG: adenylosuccinate lyase [Gammaproteobacteria bacterium]|nr:adenylosuccinate lyase [Gammaproteobacteria bacterium]